MTHNCDALPSNFYSFKENDRELPPLKYEFILSYFTKKNLNQMHAKTMASRYSLVFMF